MSLGIFLLWSVNHSFHKRNENDFSTWVSLGLYLLWSVNHSFHKRNENDFSTWFSLGILLLSSVYHIFHKINQNWKKNWTPVAKVGLINILYSNICYCQGKALESGQFVWISTDESAQNGIIFQNMLTLVADVQKWQILYQNDHLYQSWMIGMVFCLCPWEVYDLNMHGVPSIICSIMIINNRAMCIY